MRNRHWCRECGTVGRSPCSLHPSRRIGRDVDLDVVVLDRAYALDLSRHGFRNPDGSDNVQRNRAARERIDDLRKRAMARKRTMGDDGSPRVVGAIPTALLFGLKRQYGDSVLQNPREIAKGLGLWWGS